MEKKDKNKIKKEAEKDFSSNEAKYLVYGARAFYFVLYFFFYFSLMRYDNIVHYLGNFWYF